MCVTCNCSRMAVWLCANFPRTAIWCRYWCFCCCKRYRCSAVATVQSHSSASSMTATSTKASTSNGLLFALFGYGQGVCDGFVRIQSECPPDGFLRAVTPLDCRKCCSHPAVRTSRMLTHHCSAAKRNSNALRVSDVSCRLHTSHLVTSPSGAIALAQHEHNLHTAGKSCSTT